MAPVERKVQASTAAAAASGLLLWILSRYVFKSAVPDVVASWVYAAVPGVLAFAAGWLTRHTPRPDAEVTVAMTAPGVSGKPPEPPAPSA
jgi:hypothetical protein